MPATGRWDAARCLARRCFAGSAVAVIPQQRPGFALDEPERRAVSGLARQIAQTSGLGRLELPDGHDRVRGGRAGQHRHESHVQYVAAGPKPDHGDMIRAGGRAQLVDDRLDDRVRRHRSRQRSNDPAEALGLGMAPLDFDTGRSGVQDRRDDQAGNGQGQHEIDDVRPADHELDEARPMRKMTARPRSSHVRSTRGGAAGRLPAGPFLVGWLILKACRTRALFPGLGWYMLASRARTSGSKLPGPKPRRR